ncbi:hypothetical protein NDU88_004005 [Pleurodeles waltl]|uniref:Uncharacterized protein n=1 Tax=Pleurodeles waltl TaxID=8319 RepID=A0AAV7TSR0_PLEWA|nr:hypothetical protein NDU88_004005 [Pleurodeles waltl]
MGPTKGKKGGSLADDRQGRQKPEGEPKLEKGKDVELQCKEKARNAREKGIKAGEDADQKIENSGEAAGGHKEARSREREGADQHDQLLEAMNVLDQVVV